MTRAIPFFVKRRQILRATLACILMTIPMWSVEHPGIVTRDAECASCHASKMTGKSVHSAMTSPCTICHVTMTQGDMLTVSLLMPKERICSACHEQSAALKQHVPAVKGSCVDCHDAHASSRKMLLREVAALSGPKK